MKTSKKRNMIAVGLLGIFFLLAASMASAATVSLDPASQTVIQGDQLGISVLASGFDPIGVTSGSITMNWNPSIIQLDTTSLAALIDGATNTGFSDIIVFNTTVPGQLQFTAGTDFLSDPPAPPAGLGTGAFTFLNLDFTALAPPGTAVDVGLGAFGDWQYANLTTETDVGYVGAQVDVVNPVPIPGAAWLLGSGLLGLVGLKRRRKS